MSKNACITVNKIFELMRKAKFVMALICYIIITITKCTELRFLSLKKRISAKT